MPISEKVLAEIQAERDYQDAKWGGAANDRSTVAPWWALYVVKFMGKLATALMNKDMTEARRQFVKVAALAVAALEHAPDLHTAERELVLPDAPQEVKHG